MGPLQGHTAGSNNTYSAGQTVSQNNFIVPKIGVESSWKLGKTYGEEGAWDGRAEMLQSKKGRHKEGGLWETGWLKKAGRES